MRSRTNYISNGANKFSQDSLSLQITVYDWSNIFLVNVFGYFVEKFFKILTCPVKPLLKPL